MQLERDLRRTVKQQEFILHYLPIISLGCGTLAGLESPIRWKHPKKGIIPPLDFIPLAEETDLMIPIGWWVLEQSCSQLALWKKEFAGGDAFNISVNLSVIFSRMEQIASTKTNINLFACRLQNSRNDIKVLHKIRSIPF